jgi:hypothetical protein
MIRLLLKLAVVAVLANATWHLFLVYSPHYRFKDGVNYAAQYRGTLSDGELKDKVLALASQFEVPLTEDEVSVTHDGPHTVVQVSYVRGVEIVPGFARQWPLSFTVDVLTMGKEETPSLVPK